jgi:PhzF family phenazine biosynthesis protein
MVIGRRCDTRAVRRSFRQVDVFTDRPYYGNALAVVLDGSDLDARTMQRFAAWTNLSETTFLLPPTSYEADYAVRIFTPTAELPFAGHPTLGSCHAWLESGGEPRLGDVVVQECPAGLVRVRRSGALLAFAEPPLIRAGPVSDVDLRRACEQVGIAPGSVVDAQWADNGAGWIALLLDSAESVLAVRPGVVDHDIGIVGPHPPGSDVAWEVRAFFPKDGATVEDPVTGGLNASLAGWLIRSGRATAPWVAAQGTALGRAGRVHITQDAEGVIWTGGASVTCVVGGVELA